MPVDPETNDYTPKFHVLPGVQYLPPELVLHRTLDKCPRIRHVAVVIKWDDNTYSTDWSRTSTDTLAAMALILQDAVTSEMKAAVEVCQSTLTPEPA